MTKEEKNLLVKELCSRLPYGIKVLCLRDFNHDWYNLEMVDIGDNEVYVTTYEPYANRYVKIEEVKPYLFPLSSMTEEQKIEYQTLWYKIQFASQPIEFSLRELNKWLLKNHFDVNGLIPIGLAIDATNLNIY